MPRPDRYHRVMEQAVDPYAYVARRLAALRDAAQPVRMLRIASPERIVAFSRRDERASRFALACRAVEDAGFIAAVRPVGGTFAPMHGGSLVVDEFGWSPPGEWPAARFERHTHLLHDVFDSYGIDARIGEVAGEFCPGQFSINREGRVKLSGTAQRVTRGAWLVSSIVHVESAEPLRDVTTRVAQALGAAVNADVTGALSDTVAGLTPADVASRIAQRFCADGVTDVRFEGGLAET